jgi:hypothetical protein
MIKNFELDIFPNANKTAIIIPTNIDKTETCTVVKAPLTGTIRDPACAIATRSQSDRNIGSQHSLSRTHARAHTYAHTCAAHTHAPHTPLAAPLLPRGDSEANVFSTPPQEMREVPRGSSFEAVEYESRASGHDVDACGHERDSGHGCRISAAKFCTLLTLNGGRPTKQAGRRQRPTTDYDDDDDGDSRRVGRECVARHL